MSTSRSDGSSGDAEAKPEPSEQKAATAGAGAAGGGLGVSALFARAVAAQKEKAVPDPTVKAGVELTSCKHCGAPRQLEELVCRFCKERL